MTYEKARRRKPRAPEVGLTLAAARVGLVVTPVVAGLGALAGGAPTALAAGIGAGLPAGLALIALPLLWYADRVADSAIVGLSLAALGLRLGWALAIFAVLAKTEALPMEPVALGLAAGLVATITAEMRAWIREPRWSAPDPSRGRDTS